jgi:hypothetical protein
MGRQAVTDEQLACSVNDELHWDPRVDNRDIAVSASAGVVTLRGTVGSPWQSREAKRAAQRIRGVIGVENQIQVRPPPDDRLEDADLRGDVLQALTLDARIPPSVEACQGRQGHAQRPGRLAIPARGGRIRCGQRPQGGQRAEPHPVELDDPARRRPRRDQHPEGDPAGHRLDAEAIVVTAAGSTVTLNGTVHTWDEHEAALDAAWAAPDPQPFRAAGRDRGENRRLGRTLRQLQGNHPEPPRVETGATGESADGATVRIVRDLHDVRAPVCAMPSGSVDRRSNGRLPGPNRPGSALRVVSILASR